MQNNKSDRLFVAVWSKCTSNTNMKYETGEPRASVRRAVRAEWRTKMPNKKMMKTAKSYSYTHTSVCIFSFFLFFENEQPNQTQKKRAYNSNFFVALPFLPALSVRFGAVWFASIFRILKQWSLAASKDDANAYINKNLRKKVCASVSAHWVSERDRAGVRAARRMEANERKMYKEFRNV